MEDGRWRPVDECPDKDDDGNGKDDDNEEIEDNCFHQVDINTITRLTDELGSLSALQRLGQK